MLSCLRFIWDYRLFDFDYFFVILERSLHVVLFVLKRIDQLRCHLHQIVLVVPFVFIIVAKKRTFLVEESLKELRRVITLLERFDTAKKII